MSKTVEDLEKAVNSDLTTAIKTTKVVHNQLFIEANFEKLTSIILYLKSNSKCRFRQLVDITAIDYPEKEKRFTIVYFLLSHENNFRIILKVDADDKFSIPSITKIFPSANWMEREVFDMYGIYFKDHPDLRRILTDYGFEGYPLRKDFPLTGHTQVRYNEEKKKVISEQVKLDQDYRNFDFESPWDGTEYIRDKLKNKND